MKELSTSEVLSIFRLSSVKGSGNKERQQNGPRHSLTAIGDWGLLYSWGSEVWWKDFPSFSRKTDTETSGRTSREQKLRKAKGST